MENNKENIIFHTVQTDEQTKYSVDYLPCVFHYFKKQLRKCNILDLKYMDG